MRAVGSHVWVVDTIFGTVRKGIITKIREEDEDRITVYTIEEDNKYWSGDSVEGLIFNDRKDAVICLRKKLREKIKETKEMLKNIK